MNPRHRIALQGGPTWRPFIEEAAQANEFCSILNSHQHQDPYGTYEWIIAWGKAKIFRASEDQPFKELENFRRDHQDWLFGHLSFDLKNSLEDLSTEHPNVMEWANLQFFIPEHVAYQNAEGCFVESLLYSNERDFLNQLPKAISEVHSSVQNFKAQLSKEDYLRDIEALKAELQYGNIYEINYCTLFEASGKMRAYERYRYLSEKHQAPFSVYYRDQMRHLLCFSPERYLRKNNLEIISQPIKGTAARHNDPVLDQEQKAHLLSSEKERAENVMIVDLVRNDLSRTAKKNSVSVSELFGLYSFKAVHQMISTVRSELDSSSYSGEDALEQSFPMGSMTGAPKLSALELIDRYEHFRRGLYSGSVGYFDPKGNFDFNVVIRSIQYHELKERAQVAVGSAITIHCDPLAEYDECLLKAEKLIR